MARLPLLVLDPWAWVVAAGAGVVLWKSLSAAPGAPVMDDFLFLRHARLESPVHWFDGGGLGLYWRPLARQAWFGFAGPLMLSHPTVVAALQAALLALAGVLLHGAWRRILGRPAAAFAASVPVWLEAARVVVSWPSAFQELGALLGLAAAAAALASGRTRLALAASAGALLAKETAAPLVAWLAFAPLAPLGVRRGWRIAVAVLLAVWGATWAVVHATAGQVPLGAVVPAGVPLEPLPLRVLQALAWSARDALGLSALAPGWARGAGVAIGAVVLAAGLAPRRPGESARELRTSAWGLAWFVLAAAPAGWIVPSWASYRSLLPAAGLGLALAPWLGAARGGPLLAVFAIRAAALLAAPGAPSGVGVEAGGDRALHDFAQHARVQRFVTRAGRAFREAAGGGGVRTVCWHQFPRDVDYAFAEGAAFQVWAGDARVRWRPFAEWGAAPDSVGTVVLEYQHPTGEVVAVPAGIVADYLAGSEACRAGELAAGLARLDAAAARLNDSRAVVLRAQIGANRAAALRALGRDDEALAAGESALADNPDDTDARVTLAQLALARGDTLAARRNLAEQLERYPGDTQADGLARALGLTRR